MEGWPDLRQSTRQTITYRFRWLTTISNRFTTQHIYISGWISSHFPHQPPMYLTLFWLPPPGRHHPRCRLCQVIFSACPNCQVSPGWHQPRRLLCEPFTPSCTSLTAPFVGGWALSIFLPFVWALSVACTVSFSFILYCSSQHQMDTFNIPLIN